MGSVPRGVSCGVLIKDLAEGVVSLLGRDPVDLVDFCNCINYTYVLIRAPGGLLHMGLAYTPLEDLRSGEVGVRPRVEELPELVSSLDSLPRAVGVALMNAISQYLISRDGVFLEHGDFVKASLALIPRGSRVCVIGSLSPIAERLREAHEVYVMERNQALRGDKYPDTVAPLLIPRCSALFISGSSLINNTIDYLLTLRRPDSLVALVGPTAQVYPPLLHKAGIHAVASASVIKPVEAAELLRLGAGYKILDKLGLLTKYYSLANYLK